MKRECIIITTFIAIAPILNAGVVKITNNTDGIVKATIQFPTPPNGWIPHVLDRQYYIDRGTKMSYDTEALCPILVEIKGIQGTAEGEIALFKPDMEACYDTTSITASLEDGTLLIKSDYIYTD